ncbi:MAG: ABC transporter ATP-binding protein [Anaerolineae bacterium]|nr:ABC transporter ATP-binding protein [Anaerolineae bacterium]
MSNNAIEVNQLHKEFTTRVGFWSGRRKTTVAVEDISFNVHQGELFGLLGPNGAGKTTTTKVLSTLLLPTRGSVRVLGMDVVTETRTVRKRIGFTFGGARGLYGRLSGHDNLRYFAELYGLEPALARKRIAEMLEVVDLTERRNDRVENYSSGMVQRLHLARALLHDPELIYLDEPTVGIDPVGARELRQTIKNLIALKKTILLTTHYMAEAEELCDRIAIINHGRIIALDTPASLKRQVSGDTIFEIEIDAALLDELQRQLQLINHRLTIQVSEAYPNKKVNVRTDQPEAVLKYLTLFISSGHVHGLEVRNHSLEDVYVSIIQGKQE